MPDMKHGELTTSDLVVMSLLMEEPMHGYRLNSELARRNVQDWASVSRAQVYYSLEKLERRGLLQVIGGGSSPENRDGRGKRLLELSLEGRKAFAGAIGRVEWCVERAVPLFTTWLAISKRADAPTKRAQLIRRRDFIDAEMRRERETEMRIESVGEEERAAALSMIDLGLRILVAEREWIEEILSSIAAAE
jgi:DNA-binding PadR family transcriptional regulator